MAHEEYCTWNRFPSFHPPPANFNNVNTVAVAASRKEARLAHIKSHNALVQTNARWQCYGVRKFTTPKYSVEE
ncbi:hypothetical protein HZH66_012687 [Vespula vulgaris]|uniref:Uncharacterized protein n=1 Tax=Vespula vulgaris TaxID=7454 RepID=A0A834MT66_VESVU|nr:hypothetical protein HZH66_012687 [Vespula vulgaris]